MITVASEILQLLKPESGIPVAGHTPVSPGREGYGSHFWTIGQAGTFELLGKEAAVKTFKPLKDYLL